MPLAEDRRAECQIDGLEGKSLLPETWRAFKSAGTNLGVAEWAQCVENEESVEEISLDSWHSVSTVKGQLGDRQRNFEVFEVNKIMPDGGVNV